jgi:hypothetical protein
MISGNRKLPPISINSPRDTGTDLPRPSVEDEQQRRRVVVDHRCGFGAGQCAQHRFDQRIAVAAARAIEIVFERNRIKRRSDSGFGHRATDQRTP